MCIRDSRPATKKSNNAAPWIIAVVAVIMFGCAGIVVFNTITSLVGIFTDGGDVPATEVVTWEADSAELTIAASPVMAPVLADLAETFNAQTLRAPDGKNLKVTVITYDPEAMVRAAVQSPPFQAISPDSTLWLDRLEQLLSLIHI